MGRPAVTVADPEPPITLREKVSERIVPSEPEPVIVIGYVLSGTSYPTLTFIVEVKVGIAVGVKEIVTPAGCPVAERDTSELYPLMLVTTIATSLSSALDMVKVPGLAILKSGIMTEK